MPGKRRIMKSASSSPNGTPPAVEIARSSGAVPSSRRGPALIHPANDAGEKVLTIEELAEMFNVSTKTIQRWREQGLVSRRFVFDGRKRVGEAAVHGENGTLLAAARATWIAVDRDTQLGRA